MEVIVTDAQLRRIKDLLTSESLGKHDQRGLEILVGRHEKRTVASLARELGISEQAVGKRCRELVARGVDSFLDELDRDVRIVERALQLHPGDDVALFAKEFGVSERKVRYLLAERRKLSLPSSRGIRTIEGLLEWAGENAKDEPVLDLAGVSISENAAFAALALHEPAITHAHFRRFLHYELFPKTAWTELSAQDRRFSQVFVWLREIIARTPISVIDGEGDRNLKFVEEIRSRFPQPYVIVLVVDSAAQAKRLTDLADGMKRITIYCCGGPLVDWLERYFFTLRHRKSCVGLAPNLGALHFALLQTCEPAGFEWIGSANEAAAVIGRRIVANLFHAVQGHVHGMTPWLWHRLPRENTTSLIAFRWQTKVEALDTPADEIAESSEDGDDSRESLFSFSVLPGIAYLLRLSGATLPALRSDLRESGITKRVYLTNGLDNPGDIRFRHVLCDDSALKKRGEEPKPESPGSAAVLLTRHLLFPAPPLNLALIARTLAEIRSPVDRQVVATDHGPEDCLVFHCPKLLDEINAAFCSETYADRINEAAAWEEQSVFNLGGAGSPVSDGYLQEAMAQLDAHLPSLRPAGTAAETQERWLQLLYNCDADFLISGISDNAKRETEAQIDQWARLVTEIVAEVFTDSSKADFPVVAASTATRENGTADCFQESVESFARAQRRIARRAIETCTRMVMAGLPPIAVAFVPTKEIVSQFRRELRSSLRSARSGTREGVPLQLRENLTKAPSDETVRDIAELLVESHQMLETPVGADAFWEQLDELALADFRAWQDAIDLLDISEADPGELQALGWNVGMSRVLFEGLAEVLGVGGVTMALERLVAKYRECFIVSKVASSYDVPDSKESYLPKSLGTRKRKQAEERLKASAADLALLRKALTTYLCRCNIMFSDLG